MRVLDLLNAYRGSNTLKKIIAIKGTDAQVYEVLDVPVEVLNAKVKNFFFNGCAAYRVMDVVIG